MNVWTRAYLSCRPDLYLIYVTNSHMLPALDQPPNATISQQIMHAEELSVWKQRCVHFPQTSTELAVYNTALAELCLSHHTLVLQAPQTPDDGFHKNREQNTASAELCLSHHTRLMTALTCNSPPLLWIPCFDCSTAHAASALLIPPRPKKSTQRLPAPATSVLALSGFLQTS